MAVKPMFFTIRKHWKKSILAALISSYGALYAVDKYREYVLRRHFCSKVVSLGHQNVDALQLPRRLHLILNHQASGGNGAKLFEKNAAPLLHLAGIDVTVIKTDYEGHAKSIIGYIDPNTDGIIVAGGDGTVQEVVTGLLKEQDETFKKIPIGIIPLGKENNFFNRIILGGMSRQVEQIGNATLGIIKGDIESADVIEVTAGKRKTYALNSINWGVFQQVKVKIDARKHWWAGPWKKEMAFITRTLKRWPYYTRSELSINDKKIKTSTLESAYDGSHQLYLQGQKENLGDTNSGNNDSFKKTSSDSSVEHISQPQTLDSLAVHINVTKSEKNEGQVTVEIWNQHMTRTDFIKDGLKWLQANYRPIKSTLAHVYVTDSLKLIPLLEEETFYHIDGEMFEAVPIIVSLLRDKLNVFTAECMK